VFQFSGDGELEFHRFAAKETGLPGDDLIGFGEQGFQAVCPMILRICS